MSTVYLLLGDLSTPILLPKSMSLHLCVLFQFVRLRIKKLFDPTLSQPRTRLLARHSASQESQKGGFMCHGTSQMLACSQ